MPEKVSEIPRLLIVDDEAPQRKALCDTLRDHGYETTGAETGEAALEKLRAGKFDLLLTDMTMPGMNGIALLRAALAIDSDLVGIIMTGQGTITSAVEAMKEGALDYILKPFRVSVILPVIARALEVRRLRSENAALQRRIRERTRELETVNESLDSFASSVAHDLNAPARHVAGYARLVLQRHGAKLEDEVQRHLQTIAEAGERMGRLISDLLAFSRLARSELRRVPVDLGALATLVWNDLNTQREALEKDAGPRTILCNIGALPTARVDETMLRQVFFNLLANALKYTRGKNPTNIEVGSAEPREGSAVIYVRDNGVGFDPRHAEKLFGMFQRLHSTEEFEGNGIGLAHVRRIIQRHGGRIWAEANPGKGATFWFTLPLG
jgi:signal transduction histidine kinase